MARRLKSQKKADDTLVDIVEVRDSAQGFLEKNQNLLIGLVVGLIVVVGGYFFYHNFYLLPRQNEAMEQMFQAQTQFERDSFALALTNPGGGYSGFLDIIDNYGGTEAGNLAKYYAGISYLNLGQFEAAISYLEDYSADGSVTPVMKYGALGDAHAELNDLDQALKYYRRAATEGENEILAPYYLKKLGMLQEKNGNFSDAKSTYEKIKNEYPTSPYAADIDKYIIRVAAQG